MLSPVSSHIRISLFPDVKTRSAIPVVTDPGPLIDGTASIFMLLTAITPPWLLVFVMSKFDAAEKLSTVYILSFGRINILNFFPLLFKVGGTSIFTSILRMPSWPFHRYSHDFPTVDPSSNSSSTNSMTSENRNDSPRSVVTVILALRVGAEPP